MAFNQASFFLFAPRFGPSVEFDHAANTVSGMPLEIVSSCAVDPIAPKVLTRDLRQWLMVRGFAEKERYAGCQILYRGRHSTSLGVQEVVELALPLDEDEIQEIYI